MVPLPMIMSGVLASRLSKRPLSAIGAVGVVLAVRLGWKVLRAVSKSGGLVG